MVKIFDKKYKQKKTNKKYFCIEKKRRKQNFPNKLFNVKFKVWNFENETKEIWVLEYGKEEENFFKNFDINFFFFGKEIQNNNEKKWKDIITIDGYNGKMKFEKNW